ncbi:MAG: LPS-assembly protein LptD [Flavobacteriaceae bacterium]|nr:MAG: LPS-assembly protein LptD [Flavobacteriaceae bacterium]
MPRVTKDTLKPGKKDTARVQKNNSLLLKKKDTVALDSVKPKEAIQSIITHTAKDYTVQNAKEKTVTLYNEAHVVYGDIDLKAGIIIVDYKKNTLYAKGIKDSLGYLQRPVFRQGDQESEQDSLVYNFKTKQALIYNLKTIQDPGITTYGEVTKRVNDSTIYIRKIRFTTSEKEKPDYYISTDRAKLVPKKKIIVGMSNLVIADVPTPLFLPFAYFPIGERRSSGFIIPSWGENSQQGFFLQNGGYYFAINDYFDFTVTGDLYTNGSWGLRGDSNYVVRYKFNGNFSVRFENIIQSLRGFDDFSEATNFNIRWAHNQDSKASPNSRFSASVNLGSSQYFRQSLNEFNNSQFLTNTFNSSVSYQKRFVGSPFNLNITATHSQNTNTRRISMTLPSLQLTMDRIYPFTGKGGVKKNPIQKMGFNYTMQGEYRINTVDSLFLKPEMFRNAKAGMQHTTNTSTNIKVFKYFTLSPNINYKEVWNFDYINRTYDPNLVNADNTVGGTVTDTIRGFKSFREYTTGLSLSTNIYGTFNFKKSKGRLKSIRHTIRPSISYSYRPDFAGIYNRTVQQSSDPTDILTYSPFEQGVYGRPSSGLSNSIGISINNVVEGKVAPKDPDSDEEDKKITILNNLNFSTSYNIAADSLRWSPVSVTAGTRLFKDRMAVNLAASLDPYQVNSNGQRIDKFNAGIFRIASANLTANYTLSNKDFESDEKDKDQQQNNSGNGNQNTPDVLGANINPTNRFANTPQNRGGGTKKTELYKAKIPWNVNLAYTATYVNNGVRNIGISIHSVIFSGNLELSPKWNVGFSSGYDIVGGGFTFSRFNFSRDLDSWKFNFNWVPFGTNTSYNFFIGVKSSVLSDLKWDKNQPPDRVLF